MIAGRGLVALLGDTGPALELTDALLRSAASTNPYEAGVTLETPEHKALAAALVGAKPEAAGVVPAWPTAHRTQWLLEVLEAGRRRHALHVEALAFELRVSSMLALPPANGAK